MNDIINRECGYYMKEDGKVVWKKFMYSNINGKIEYSPSMEPSMFLNADEMVKDLIENRLDDALKAEIKGMEKDDLIMLHHGFGTAIRNNYALWVEENPHTDNNDSVGDGHADQYSFLVIEKLHAELNSLNRAYDAAMKVLR